MKKRYYIMYEECEDEYQVIDRELNEIVFVFDTDEEARHLQDNLNRREEEWLK